MNLLQWLKGDTASYNAPTLDFNPKPAPLTDVEQKLIDLIKDKPTEWAISKIPCDELTERELSIVHNKSNTQIVMREDAMTRAVSGMNSLPTPFGPVPLPAAGRARFMRHYFSKAFSVEFGKLAYALFLKQETERSAKDAENSLNILKQKLQIKL